MTVDDVLAAHREAGRRFSAAGVGSFVLEAGPANGEPVVCLHGVPASSYLYRKVLPALASRGLRGVAFDLPGLGLADRPPDFDYSWTGLGSWAHAALDALGLDQVHLVVHDIGGPVGFELAFAAPERVRSLLVLNTTVAVDTFRRPWVMEPFAYRYAGEAWLACTRLPGVFRTLMRLIAVSRSVPSAEIDAYLPLLLGDDGGRAFLRIMRSFERTAEKGRRYERVVGSTAFPVGLLWGRNDPALPLRTYGAQARLAIGADGYPACPASTSSRRTFRTRSPKP